MLQLNNLSGLNHPVNSFKTKKEEGREKRENSKHTISKCFHTFSVHVVFRD